MFKLALAAAPLGTSHAPLTISGGDDPLDDSIFCNSGRAQAATLIQVAQHLKCLYVPNGFLHKVCCFFRTEHRAALVLVPVGERVEVRTALEAVTASDFNAIATSLDSSPDFSSSPRSSLMMQGSVYSRLIQSRDGFQFQFQFL